MQQRLSTKLLLTMFAIGLVSCFLPAAQFQIADSYFVTNIMDDYSGWPTFFFLILGSVYTVWKYYRNHHPAPLPIALLGIYIIGYVLFRTYHLFTIFNGKSTESLAFELNTTSHLREGLILLAFSGFGILFYAYKSHKVNFQP